MVRCGVMIAAVAAGVLSASAMQCCGGPSKASAAEAKAKVKPQTVCPVMGGKINKSLYVDYQGQRIYMCCKGCTAALKKDPAKYIKKIIARGETPAKLQTTCPVMGGKINRKQYVDHDGKRIYVCCPGCIPKIKAAPQKYISKLENEGVTLEHADAKKTARKVVEKARH
jgi:YHS domain-containing protein